MLLPRATGWIEACAPCINALMLIGLKWQCWYSLVFLIITHKSWRTKISPFLADQCAFGSWRPGWNGYWRHHSHRFLSDTFREFNTVRLSTSIRSEKMQRNCCRHTAYAALVVLAHHCRVVFFCPRSLYLCFSARTRFLRNGEVIANWKNRMRRIVIRCHRLAVGGYAATVCGWCVCVRSWTGAHLNRCGIDDADKKTYIATANSGWDNVTMGCRMCVPFNTSTITIFLAIAHVDPIQLHAACKSILSENTHAPAHSPGFDYTNSILAMTYSCAHTYEYMTMVLLT